MLALGLFTVLAATLRFCHLFSPDSLWFDELATWALTAKPTLQTMLQNVVEEPCPPGYYVVIWCTRFIFGDSEWSLRLPSLVAGIACVPAAYFTGKEYWGRAEGLMASLLIAITPVAVYYSQQARSYSLLILFSFFIAYAAKRILNGNRRFFDHVFLIVALYVSLTLHYFAAFTVLYFVGVMVWSTIARRDKKLFLSTCLCSLFTLLLISPILPVYFRDVFHPVTRLSWIPQPTAETVRDSYTWIWSYDTLGLYLMYASLGLALAKWSLKRSSGASGGSSGVVIFSLSILLILSSVYVISMYSSSIFVRRSLLILLPSYILLMAYGSVPGPPKLRFLAAAPWLVTAFFIYFPAHEFTLEGKEDWRAALRWAGTKSPSSELFISAPSFTKYYYRDSFPAPRVHELKEQTKILDPAVVANAEMLIIIQRSYNAPELLLEDLAKTFELVKTPLFEGLVVHEFIRRTKPLVR